MTDKEDAKVFVRHLHAGADARLAEAEDVSCMAKVEIFGDGDRLDQRLEGNTRP